MTQPFAILAVGNVIRVVDECLRNEGVAVCVVMCCKGC